MLLKYPMPVAGCPKLNVGSQEKKRGVPCLSVEEGNKQVEATDALVILLLDASLCLLSCWQKRGFRPALPTIGFEPMTLAV